MKPRDLAMPLFVLGLAAASPIQEAQADGLPSVSVSMPEAANALEQRVGSPINMGNVVRLKLQVNGANITDNKLQLTGGAYLQIEEDGKMRFVNAGFEGYAMLTYSNNLIVYDQTGKALVAIENVGSEKKTTYQPGLNPAESAAAQRAVSLLCGC